ncbi:MAG: ABC transporter ATP-binding protein [Halolamina sp.]
MAIDIENLSKHYGDVVANESLSFTVEEGEIFGYLGPNGAGKTTTIRTLLGLLNPTAGTAALLGADINDDAALLEAKRRIGYLPDDPEFNEEVTGERILEYHGSVKGDERREELLALFSPPLDRSVRTYSSGNKQMLGIVQAFMHDPDLVIMDEPTAGLDPLKQARFNEFLRAERDRGTTIFFSSHVLSEVRRVCDRVAILRNGELVALEEIDSLLRKGGKRVHVRSPDDTLEAELRSIDDVIDISTAGEEIQFTYTGEYNRLLAQLTNYDIIDIDINEPPLEDVFMHYYSGSSGDSVPDDSLAEAEVTADE